MSYVKIKDLSCDHTGVVVHIYNHQNETPSES